MIRLASNDDSIAEVVEKMATKTIYAASGVAAVGGFTMDEWGVFFGCVGVIIGIATFAFNAWFKMKYLKPEKRGKSKISERRKKPRGDDAIS